MDRWQEGLSSGKVAVTKQAQAPISACLASPDGRREKPKFHVPSPDWLIRPDPRSCQILHYVFCFCRVSDKRIFGYIRAHSIDNGLKASLSLATATVSDRPLP